MTQKELIIQYIKQYKKITPAKMGGVYYLGQIFGSETNRRWRELRAEGVLSSRKEGRFEVFYLAPQEGQKQLL